MILLATLNSDIEGVTSGEHCGHIPPHPPITITGQITAKVSDFVYIEGKPIALDKSVTTEYDGCCGSSNGVVDATTTLLFHKGIKVARLNDPLSPHNGSGKVTEVTHSLVFSQ